MAPVASNIQNIQVHVQTHYPIFSSLQKLLPTNFQVESTIDTSGTYQTELVYGVGVDMQLLQQFLQALNYLPISQRRSSDIDPTAIHLSIGESSASEYNITIKSNTQSFLDTLTNTLGSMVVDAERKMKMRVGNSIQYGGANESYIRLLALQLQILTGEEVELNKSWNDDDQDVWIEVVDPETKGKPVRSWLPLLVSSDSPQFAEQAVSAFKQAGFEQARLAEDSEKATSHQGFMFEPGALNDNAHMPPRHRNRKNRNQNTSTDINDIQTIVQSMLSSESIDNIKFPLGVSSDTDNALPIVHLPIAKCKNGGMMPYGGNFPGAYPVQIRTDDLTLASELGDQLRQMGFAVDTAFVQSSALLNPCLDWGEFNTHILASDLRDTIQNFLNAKGLPNLLPPVVRKSDSKQINIDLPSAQNFPLNKRRYRSIGRQYTVSINLHRSNPHYATIERSLKELGVRRIRTRTGRGPGENTIHFGGAPTALMAEVLTVVQPYMNDEIDMSQYWGDEDTDIYIFFPDLEDEVKPQQEVFDVQKWLGNAKVSSRQPFVGKSLFGLNIGTVTLPLSNRFDHPRTPNQEDFEHYCIDSQTAGLLERISEAVVGRECLLLEGSTATSKTSSILYLASQVGQPVMRLNLSGATDVSEFVGRFVPDESRAGNGWRWEDGPVIKAMTEGYWLILDELNLAEASVLERLNSLLERTPSLLLSEYNDKLIGGEEHPVHDGFRVFGTQNPEHYAGRNALSPAYRDRFHETHVRNPNLNAKAMEEMMTWLVFGRTPKITVNGVEYESSGNGTRTELADIPSMSKFLKSVAIFHASLCAACTSENGGVPKIGADRMGGYSFTRRGLLRLIDFLERHASPDLSDQEMNRIYRLGLVRTYLERVDVHEQHQVVNLMNAAGIGPETWVV